MTGVAVCSTAHTPSPSPRHTHGPLVEHRVGVVPEEVLDDELATHLQLEPDRVRELLRMAQDPLSLGSPVGDEDASILGDFIEDESADEPSDAATRAMLAQVVEDVLDGLSPREQEIVRMRFGLDGNRAQTLEAW